MYRVWVSAGGQGMPQISMEPFTKPEKVFDLNRNGNIPAQYPFSDFD